MAWCERNDENVAKDHFLDESKDTSDGKQLSLKVCCKAYSVEDCPMGPVLSGQLQSVLQEGLLDSLLPYLVQDKPVGKVGIGKTLSLISKQTHLQLPDLSSESDSPPGAGNLYRMPPMSMSRQSSGIKSRQNSTNRILLARDHTREDKTPRALAESK